MIELRLRNSFVLPICARLATGRQAHYWRPISKVLAG